MVTAIKTVHWEKGIWTTRGGYEYNLVLIAAAIGVTENGPGPWSVDGALGRPRWGTGWALAALGAGVAGSAAALAAAKRGEEQDESQAVTEDQAVPAMT
jgi:putative oxidoreductase